MRDPKRIPEMLNELKGIWSSFPDLRLGQLLLNVMHNPQLSADQSEQKFYYMEDDELIKMIRHHYREVINIGPTS